MLVALLAAVAVILTAVLALRPKHAAAAPLSPLKGEKRSREHTDAFRYDEVAIDPLNEFDVAKTEPYPYRPWKSGKFVMTMGIRKLAQEEWLGLDNRYWKEQDLRRNLLENHHDGVTQALPGSEAACIEVLDMVVSYLTRRYPQLFFHPEGKIDHIHNKLTGLTFRIKAPYEIPPLEVAAQLVMEDLNIMIQGLGPNKDHHYL